MGPLNNDKQVEFIEKNIKQSVEQGAKVICGGKKLQNFLKDVIFYQLLLSVLIEL